MSDRIANVSQLIVIVSDAYGGLRLHIKDVVHHIANVNSRIANVIPIYAIDATAPSY